MFKRIILIVLDSVGIGELPDAHIYNDVGANTLGNIAKMSENLHLPYMQSLGLGCIAPIEGVNCQQPIGYFGKMAELSKGKDTTSGHWEIAGCPLDMSFPVFPEGFPDELIKKFIKVTGYTPLGNKAASGTQIIVELGQEHIRTGQPIVYTSADSVLQIAAHEDVISLDKLYNICRLVREKVCVGKYAVGRIIARPFVGTYPDFVRTANRHDYSLEPPCTTMLDILSDNNFQVTGIGKIGDIYAHRGLTNSIPSKSNQDGIDRLIDCINKEQNNGLIMINLVEFDSLYGHRRDVSGYKLALEQFDSRLPEIIAALLDDDLLLITADHGCDPTFRGTDHTREYVPILGYYKNCQGGYLGIRNTFADVAATVIDNFQLTKLKIGSSFLPILRGK